MAKFTKTFEDGEIKNTLFFREREFTLTMKEWESGERKGEEKCFSDQLDEAFPNDEEIEDFLGRYDIDTLDCGNEDEIEQILKELTQME